MVIICQLFFNMINWNFLYRYLTKELHKESSADIKPNYAATPTNTITPIDFEEAIAATSYGKFNLLLMLIAMPCCMSCVYESACISYIIPTAECDLQLSLIGKGMLNAIVYAGTYNMNSI